MNHTSIIELNGIVKNFKVGKEVINLYENLNFQCKDKEFIVLSGASGSGKSTILSIIAGLTSVDQGIVRILNHNIQEFDEETLAIFRSTNIGIVFQMGHLIDTLTILENVLLPVELAQRKEIDFVERAWDLLDEFYLSHRAHSLPRMVSGGEFQRTAFIRALILDPPLLLVDEPTANLDLRWRREVVSAIETVHAAENVTTVMVCHEPDVIPPSCDGLLLLDEGKVLAAGPQADVLRDENISRLFGTRIHVVWAGSREASAAEGEGR